MEVSFYYNIGRIFVSGRRLGYGDTSSGHVPPPDAFHESVCRGSKRHLFYVRHGAEAFNLTALQQMNIHFLRERAYRRSRGRHAAGEDGGREFEEDSGVDAGLLQVPPPP